ncbi:MAG: iron-containing alcohol dehydrogenase [Lachnospiraceae bacterium]|jgi:alcohol dehydrogenase
MRQTFSFFEPTHVLFGCGVLNDLHKQKMPGRKALLVISGGKSVIRNGYLDRTEKELEAAGVSFVLFNKVEANPVKSTVEEGARTARENGCDFVVALGGGSVLDAAKIMAMFAPQPSDDLWDYAGGLTGKNKTLEKEPLPWIAIPTTAGTGSEVDANGVVTNPATNEKIGLGRMDSLFAKIAVVDPELTASVPPKFTAFQGFDALFHSLECHLSVNACAFSDMVTRSAIENVGRYLVRAVKDGRDMEAREGMSFASMLGGYAMITSSCIGEHALEHAMSAYYPALPHGAGLIMISKAYFSHFVKLHCADDRFINMAKFLGKKDADRPEDFLEVLAALERDCGVDSLRMSDYGIRKEDAAKMADNAIATTQRLLKFDPVPLTREECIRIYEESWK